MDSPGYLTALLAHGRDAESRQWLRQAYALGYADHHTGNAPALEPSDESWEVVTGKPGEVIAADDRGKGTLTLLAEICELRAAHVRLTTRIGELAARYEEQARLSRQHLQWTGNPEAVREAGKREAYGECAAELGRLLDGQE